MTECPICLESIAAPPGQWGVLSPCGHAYHHRCWEEVVANHYGGGVQISILSGPLCALCNGESYRFVPVFLDLDALGCNSTGVANASGDTDRVDIGITSSTSSTSSNSSNSSTSTTSSTSSTSSDSSDSSDSTSSDSSDSSISSTSPRSFSTTNWNGNHNRGSLLERSRGSTTIESSRESERSNSTAALRPNFIRYLLSIDWYQVNANIGDFMGGCMEKMEMTMISILLPFTLCFALAGCVVISSMDLPLIYVYLFVIGTKFYTALSTLPDTTKILGVMFGVNEPMKSTIITVPSCALFFILWMILSDVLFALTILILTVLHVIIVGHRSTAEMVSVTFVTFFHAFGLVIGAVLF